MSLCKTAMSLLFLYAEKEGGEPMWFYYSNRSFNNCAFCVGRIDLLASQLNHKKKQRTESKKEGVTS